MTSPYYRGTGTRAAGEPVPLPSLRLARDTDPRFYRPDAGLVAAANVALHLGQPLLLAGEPGTGKTQLAYALAWELGYEPPIKFDTKSTSTARDVFYTYDALGRFHAAQTGAASADPRGFLTFAALGETLLRAASAEVVKSLGRDVEGHVPRRSVVLIDEVDKAPRDFPNDILNEIEGMYFRIPELGNFEVRAEPALAPIVILTSNSEKSLPDAFLRRCAFYYIPFPERARLEEIVAARVSGDEGLPEGLLAAALDFFVELRRPEHPLSRRPSTGEFLAWLRALAVAVPGGAPDLGGSVARVTPTLSALLKTGDDLSTALGLLQTWMSSRRR